MYNKKVIGFSLMLLLIISISVLLIPSKEHSTEHQEEANESYGTVGERQENRTESIPETPPPGKEPDYIIDFVPPPYIEIQYLYNDFPVLVKTSKQLNIDNINFVFYYNGTKHKLNISSYNVKIYGEVYYYVFRLKFDCGYYKPGTYSLVLELPDGAVVRNLTIVGPPVFEVIPPGDVREENGRVVVGWPPEAGTVVGAIVADCEPGTYMVSFSGEGLVVEVGEGCCAESVHTLVVSVLQGNETIFYILSIP